MKNYQSENIFAKIIRKEIPATPTLETEKSLCLADISPQAPVHELVLPKGAYSDIVDFAEHATEAEMVDFIKTIGRLAKKKGVEKEGFRLIINTGVNGGQEVPHLHAHLLGGKPIGRIVATEEEK